MATKSTSLSLALEATYKKEQYNRNAKSILSHTALLAWILKSCVVEFKDLSVEFIQENCIEGTPVIGKEAVHQNTLDADKRITGLDTVTSSVDEEENTFDVRFNAIVPDTKEPVELYINIEFQKKAKNLGYPLPKRGGYYCSRMISNQYGTVFTHSEYGKIRKVYSIWICPNVGQDDEDSIVKYRITPEVLHGNVETKPEEYDILDITIISLTMDFLESKSDIIRLLGTIFMPVLSFSDKKKRLEDDFGIPMSRELEEDLSVMCNLSDGIYEYAEARGRATGEIIGAIKTYKRIGKLPTEIIGLIKTDYDLKQEVAEKLVEETLGLQPA